MNVLYVTYDGLFDPLGATQVLPYVEGLADRGVTFTLVSFEKPDRDTPDSRSSVVERLAGRTIRWIPLRYRKRPRLPATLLDVLAGARAIGKAVSAAGGVDLIHSRGDVTMAMARAGARGSIPLLYDVRGLYADERVESGSWARGGLVDRLVRHAEAGNLRRASGVVTLTRPALAVLRSRRPSLPPHRVIPTCADLAAFRPAPAPTIGEYGLVYSGSLGGWYMGREMVDCARVATGVIGRPLFLTPNLDDARALGVDDGWADARVAAPADVPSWLRRSRAAFFFIRPTPAKRASCPTKLAEALATGLPVLANRGIGDVDETLETERVGVLLESFDRVGYQKALTRLVDLLRDPETPKRCRRVAERMFSLSSAVAAYHGLYQEIRNADPARATAVADGT